MIEYLSVRRFSNQLFQSTNIGTKSVLDLNIEFSCLLRILIHERLRRKFLVCYVGKKSSKLGVNIFDKKTECSDTWHIPEKFDTTLCEYVLAHPATCFKNIFIIIQCFICALLEALLVGLSNFFGRDRNCSLKSVIKITTLQSI